MPNGKTAKPEHAELRGNKESSRCVMSRASMLLSERARLRNGGEMSGWTKSGTSKDNPIRVQLLREAAKPDVEKSGAGGEKPACAMPNRESALSEQTELCNKRGALRWLQSKADTNTSKQAKLCDESDTPRCTHSRASKGGSERVKLLRSREMPRLEQSRAEGMKPSYVSSTLLRQKTNPFSCVSVY